jgi:hypothetical protein
MFEQSIIICTKPPAQRIPQYVRSLLLYKFDSKFVVPTIPEVLDALRHREDSVANLFRFAADVDEIALLGDVPGHQRNILLSARFP